MLAAWPDESIGSLLRAAAHVPAYFSPTSLDNAGNSTGILMLSALASLSWMREGRSTAGTLLIAGFGIIAGFGA